MLFDTHCHLDASEFDPDRPAVVAAARNAGVDQILVPAVAVANFAAVRACCAHYAGCLPAYGIHPLYVESSSDDDLAVLRRHLGHEMEGELPALAIGEIGLDFFAPGVDVDRQAHFLREQLRIAADLNLPVVLHVRRAIDAVLGQLRATPVCGGIAHAFNGSREQAEHFIKRGFCLGFGGAMTYPGSSRIRRLAATLPIESIVLETDAPDIAPAWLEREDGRARNTPGQLFRIAEVLAELRGAAVTNIIEVTAGNARRCLRMTE
ncbi:TatD family hydrolase [uncultured Propionivibrio sp.]|uniref:TatD family hydrolase n=1 Tax=uncultured Propionivibrio sp. TaxID=426737 RepID=UPI0029C08F4E|nr:TatD family hydrolase [uncultured Propionivibrio sp.]